MYGRCRQVTRTNARRPSSSAASQYRPRLPSPLDVIVIAGALVVALTLAASGVSSSTEQAVTPFGQGQPAWSTAESQHFEIHYLPSLSAELDRVVRVAEPAYRRVSDRLNFVLPTKVPVVLFAPSGPLSREQVVAYATSDAVAPPDLVSEIILPGRGGDGGVPRWVQEGIASYMVGVWPDDDERLMRELVASGDVPALSQLTGSGGFANARLNDALGHAAFDYIENRFRKRRMLVGPHAFGKFAWAGAHDCERALTASANHIPMSRPPSRRQPFAVERA
jgi:hypothetical protein